MVFITVLAWIKMRNGARTPLIDSAYDEVVPSARWRGQNVIDREAQEEREEARQACIWPCDALAIAWNRFAMKSSQSDVRIAMLMFTLFASLPSWIAVLVICSTFGLEFWRCCVPAWAIFDFCALAIYYACRFGSEVLCTARKRLRFWYSERAARLASSLP